MTVESLGSPETGASNGEGGALIGMGKEEGLCSSLGTSRGGLMFVLGFWCSWEQSEIKTGWGGISSRGDGVGSKEGSTGEGSTLFLRLEHFLILFLFFPSSSDGGGASSGNSYHSGSFSSEGASWGFMICSTSRTAWGE